MYDIIIIGSGPAGMAAAVYTAKNKLKTLVLGKEHHVYELEGDLALLKFADLKKTFESELKANTENLEFQNNLEITALEKNVVSFSVEIKSGALFYSKAVIIATGRTGANFDLLTNKDSAEKIKVDANMKTNIPGIFAAGDATMAAGYDFFVSAGQGAKAALSAVEFLNTK